MLGIPYPPVTPFFGNTLQIHKQVSSSIYYSKAISLYRVFWNHSMNGLRDMVKCLGKWIKLMFLCHDYSTVFIAQVNCIREVLLLLKFMCQFNYSNSIGSIWVPSPSCMLLILML